MSDSDNQWKRLGTGAIVAFFLLIPFLPIAQVINYPHIEDFEFEYQCPTGCGSVSCNLIGSWQNTGGDDRNWLSDRANTPSGNTGPSFDHTRGDNQGHFVYIESSCDQLGYPFKRGDLLSAYYDFRNIGPDIRMEVWYHMRGVHMGDLHFDVDTTQGQGAWIVDFVPDWTDNVNAWQKRTLDLSSLAGKDSVRFRFRGVTGTNYAGDMALDDIKVYEPEDVDVGVTAIVSPSSSCSLGPTTQVVVEVTSWGLLPLLPGDSIPIRMQLDNLPPVLETYVLQDTLFACESFTDTLQATLDLSDLRTYTLDVQTRHPQDSVFSNDSKEKTIESLPSIDAFPYCETFEDGPGGWYVGGDAPSWNLGTPTTGTINAASSGWNAWVTNPSGQYNIRERSYVQSPCFDFSNLCRPVVRLNIWFESETAYDGANIQVSTNEGQSWALLGTVGSTPNWYNFNSLDGRPGGSLVGWSGADTAGSGGWLSAYNFLTAYAGEPRVMFRVNFGSDQSVNDEGFAFDDFQVFDGIFIGKDTSICTPATPFVLDAGGISTIDNYLWSTGATTQTITVSNPGSYSVEVWNSFICDTIRDTINVIGIGPGFSLSAGADTTVCGGLQLDAGTTPDYLYYWSTGDSGRYVTVDSSGAYWFDAVGPCGTVRSDTVQVTVLAAPLVSLGPDTTYCGARQLDAGAGATSYVWSNGATTQSIAALNSGVYGVTVSSGNGCTTSDSVEVVILPVPAVQIGQDTAICFGDTLCLDAGFDPNSSYLWNTGPVTSNLCVTNSGGYSITVTNSSGCVGSDSLFVQKPAPPLANFSFDTLGCPTITFFGNSAAGPAWSWWWDFGDGATDTVQNPVHQYTSTGNYIVRLAVSNPCGMDTLLDVVFIECAIGIDDSFASELKVWPNPSDGNFRLKVEGLAEDGLLLRVRDLYGRELVQQSFAGRWVDTALDLSRFAKGLYFLELENGGRREVLRLIKE